MPSWVHQYWAWAGSNIGALPAEMVITAVVTVLGAVAFRPLLRRVWKWIKHEIAGEAHKEAILARRINADIYRHLTGEHHPHAPRE